jgi:hypothetical protein
VTGGPRRPRKRNRSPLSPYPGGRRRPGAAGRAPGTPAPPPPRPASPGPRPPPAPRRGPPAPAPGGAIWPGAGTRVRSGVWDEGQVGSLGRGSGMRDGGGAWRQSLGAYFCRGLGRGSGARDGGGALGQSLGAYFCRGLGRGSGRESGTRVRDEGWRGSLAAVLGGVFLPGELGESLPWGWLVSESGGGAWRQSLGASFCRGLGRGSGMRMRDEGWRGSWAAVLGGVLLPGAGARVRSGVWDEGQG